MEGVAPTRTKLYCHNSLTHRRHPNPDHPRLDEIRVISQTLAFSSATPKDSKQITTLMNNAYNKAERNNGIEKFRTGDVIDEETVKAMIEDKGCEIVIAEVPDGKRVVKNGAIIAVCCYGVGGNAVTEEEEEVRGLGLGLGGEGVP